VAAVLVCERDRGDDPPGIPAVKHHAASRQGAADRDSAVCALTMVWGSAR